MTVHYTTADGNNEKFTQPSQSRESENTTDLPPIQSTVSKFSQDQIRCGKQDSEKGLRSLKSNPAISVLRII